MGKKLPEFVMKRHFLDMYVCMKCNAKLRSSLERVKRGDVKCRKCGSKQLRLKAKERRGVNA